MNTIMPFLWSEMNDPKEINVPAIHADLLAVSSHELKDKVDLRCRFCDGKIKYFENWADQSESEFACFGVSNVSYIVYGEEYCYNKMRRWELAKATEDEMNRRFYVKLRLPEDKIFRLCFSEKGPLTSYHYVREATDEEYREEAVKVLEKIRKQAIEGGP